MGTWALIQVVFDIFAALGFFVIAMRMSRAPKDDPRLSRGLQLLQSKISVIEDLSDRTETQVGQLTAILDQKAREVQAKVQLAEQHVNAIRVSTERSLEVAKIFQDKIPHQEIIERQNTIKYVQAARLAHQGVPTEEICRRVDLPTGEIEFIAKVNRDRLMFNEEALPVWAKDGQATDALPPPPENPSASVLEPVAPQASAAAETPAAPDMDPAERLRVEIEIAERQQLVESLSRLQFEMQTLDQQLARETGHRDLSGAFEAPRVETGSLNKLGEEFRRACEEAEQKNQRSSLLPPLEQLTSLIPQIFDAPATTPAPMAAAAPAAMPVSPAPMAQAPVPPAPVAPTAPMPSAPRDPVLARAAAQAKVQAALARSKAPGPREASAPAPLAAARAVAKEMAQPAVRKVEFPKIENP